MLNSSYPLTHVVAPIIPFHLSMTVSLIFLVLTFVCISRWPCKLAISMLFIVFVFTLKVEKLGPLTWLVLLLDCLAH
jgi:hypothetical protein